MSLKSWFRDRPLVAMDPHPEPSTVWNGGRVVGAPTDEDFASESRAEVSTPKAGA